MSDLKALYRAVLANPDEDTPRLMYADELEGTDPARAELIRVQCALAEYNRQGHGITYRECPQMAGGVSGHCDDCEKALAVERRLTDLLTKANRERWEPACLACGGAGKVKYRAERVTVGGEVIAVNVPVSRQCNACSGTGRQPCRWERGFPVVQIAEMRQAWSNDQWTGQSLRWGDDFWHPTQWLRDLLRTYHVAGVVPGDCKPHRHQSRAWHYWNPPQMPPAVFRQCRRSHKNPDALIKSLGRAVVLAALEWIDTQGAA